MKNLGLDSDWEFIDISDTLQFFFEINIKFTNVASQSIVVYLRNKLTNKQLSKIRFVDKNIIKFSEERENLKHLQNLNQKYELYWELKENKRNGIIHFNKPIQLEVRSIAVFLSENGIPNKTMLKNNANCKGVWRNPASR